MTKIDDGGAAFPLSDTLRTDGEHVLHAERGMSLRDYFAGQALPALIRRCVTEEGWRRCIPAAFEAADAMLEARKTGGAK